MKREIYAKLLESPNLSSNQTTTSRVSSAPFLLIPVWTSCRRIPSSS